MKALSIKSEFSHGIIATRRKQTTTVNHGHLVAIVSCLTSPVSRPLSHISCLTCPVSCFLSPVSRLLSHVSCLMSPVSRLLYPVSCILSHVSCLTSPFSRLLSHIPCLRCPVMCPIMLSYLATVSFSLLKNRLLQSVLNNNSWVF